MSGLGASRVLEEDFGGDLWLATLSDELDGCVQIRFAVRQSLSERERISGLHQHV